MTRSGSATQILRSVVGAAVALALFSATGCAATVPEAAPSSSATTEAPRPTPTPTPTPAPTEDPGDPDTWLVTQLGIGPLRIGDPFDAARALLPSGAEHDAENCRWTAWWRDSDDDGQIYLAGEPSQDSDAVGPVDLVASAAWNATTLTGPRTAEGVGAGSTWDEVRAAYPDAVEGTGSIAGTHLQVDRIFFSFPEGAVHAASVIVTTGSEPPYEVCG